jgi:hypothetical protein
MYRLPGTGKLASDTIRKNIEGETAIAQLIEGWRPLDRLKAIK